jgi:hypothetical protein
MDGGLAGRTEEWVVGCVNKNESMDAGLNG